MYHAERRLQGLAAMAACPVQPESVAMARNFGDWLLMTLLSRREAAPLRALANVETEWLYTGDTKPWQVFIHDSEDYGAQPFSALIKPETAAEIAAFDARLLEFTYPYTLETGLPAKVTATQLKGRLLDEEISEHTVRPPYLRPLRQPRFRQERAGLTPAERGTATHLVLQYLDFSNPDVEAQVERMKRKELISSQQADAVNVGELKTFLVSPLAEKIRSADCVHREYRFTVMMDVKEYEPDAAGEDEILLQGVVDCWFETEQGVTVVDFKTDAVATPGEQARRAEEYRFQLEAYSRALEQVLEKKVTRRVLYFLKTGEAVDV